MVLGCKRDVEDNGQVKLGVAGQVDHVDPESGESMVFTCRFRREMTVKEYSVLTDQSVNEITSKLSMDDWENNGGLDWDRTFDDGSGISVPVSERQWLAFMKFGRDVLYDDIPLNFIRFNWEILLSLTNYKNLSYLNVHFLPKLLEKAKLLRRVRKVFSLRLQSWRVISIFNRFAQ